MKIIKRPIHDRLVRLTTGISPSEIAYIELTESEMRELKKDRGLDENKHYYLEFLGIPVTTEEQNAPTY